MSTHGMDAAASEVSAHLDTCLACLVMLARFYQVAASAEQIAHEFGYPDQTLGTAQLILEVEALRLGLKATTAKTSVVQLGQTFLPAIAKDRDVEFFIPAHFDQGKALIHDPKWKRPEFISLDVLETRWVGALILRRPKAGISYETSSPTSLGSFL